MSALITQVNNGGIVVPGEYNRGIGQYSMRAPAPLAATASSLAPGLFCAREATSTDFTKVTSVDEISSPDITDIVGIVARQKVQYGGVLEFQQILSNLYGVGSVLDVLNWANGYVWVWASNAITDPSSVHIATTTTGTGGSLIVAGSVVAAGTAGALDISSIAEFSAYNGSSFNIPAQSLVAVVLSDLRR